GYNPTVFNNAVGGGGTMPMNSGINIPSGTNANPQPAGSGNDLTGAYMGMAGVMGQPGARIPHVIPNPFDNTLLVQGSPQECEQMLAVSAAESANKSRIISSPSIIATDSIPAVMNVGQDVPVLTSSGVAVTGSSFNSITNRSTGTTLSVMARVNSSGVVTLIIDQDVSSPISASSDGIGSPSFSRRSFSTQVTVQD